MRPSMFNLTVPLTGGDVFLMNTLTDAQAVVSADVVRLLDRLAAEEAGRGLPGDLSGDEHETLRALSEEGFLVESPDRERERLDAYFREFHEDTGELRVTVLTTLQCNFACGYCIQGDHEDHNRLARKMSVEAAGRVADWIEQRLDELRPERFVLSFFGGEPLLNLPVVYALAERLWHSCARRGVQQLVNVITNGLLLTPEVVDRLVPLGLNGVKVTLDGDQVTHDRMRPLRGGQGTFDRIVANVRAVAGRCRVSIGGNFDESSVANYPALLAFLREQDFAPALARVSFKPIVGQRPAKGVIPLTVVDGAGKPLGGSCMTAAGAGKSSPCDSCHFLDEQMSFLREETKRHGFATLDGVHMGPCEIHRRHAYTVGPEGDLYACPGFAGETEHAVGHIDGRTAPGRAAAAAQFDRLAPWKQCGDCAFIPVCGGGCVVASHNELGDMHAPTCHKPSFESALESLARDRVSEAEGGQS